LSDYRDDVGQGADKQQARKRALKSTAADIFTKAGKAMSGNGVRRRRLLVKKRTNKKKCCRVKKLSGAGRRRPTNKRVAKKRRGSSQKRKAIKGTTKYDLLSL